MNTARDTYPLWGKGYGLLPEREMWIASWEEVAIYLIGPCTVKVNNQKVEFNAQTCIDTASNLVKLIRIDNKTSRHIRNKFLQSWLACYPRPNHCVHDKGGKFIGGTFQWPVAPPQFWHQGCSIHSKESAIELDLQAYAPNSGQRAYSTAIHRKIWHRPETLATRHWQRRCMPCKLQQPPHSAARQGLLHSAVTCSWMSSW